MAEDKESQRKQMTEANEAQRKEMMAANQALSAEFVKALKEERESCDARHASLIASFEKRHESLQVAHAKEIDGHYEMMKEWRKEIVAESKSTRDLLQLWVGRMAIARSIAENEQDTSKPARTKSGGTS
jgi:chorismate mutase